MSKNLLKKTNNDIIKLKEINKNIEEHNEMIEKKK